MREDQRAYRKPAVRRLRVYAFDPQASTRLETAGVNQAVITLPWEQEWEANLEPGPVNEYLEVMDVDPVSDQFYEPVDLDDPYLLAQDGLDPSEGDPRFHQQMVFAVAMKTIKTFERALGRKVFWSPEWIPNPKLAGGGFYKSVDRLRVYPHALREPNAYYDPVKKALLFGYFRAPTRTAGASWVFTALSHDIVVHETTHAILDGLHRRYIEPTSVDSLAFHEAFADIVALLSHFTLGEAVSNEIATRGGNLSERSLMSGLARQFGEATGRYAALRDAIDAKGADDLPDPEALTKAHEPHERGSILVAAVFDAFLTIYQRRTADLMRIGGVGVEPGVRRNLHPDLVARLTKEAVKAADHVLRMCIRALDYLPPVDVRFGEFLRAIITADADLVPDDPLQYRLAVVEGFRRRGILPDQCLSLAPDSLLWEGPEDSKLKAADILKRELGSGRPTARLDLEPKFKRKAAQRAAERNRAAVWQWLTESEGPEKDARWEAALGVKFAIKEPWEFNTISHRPGRGGGSGRTRPAVEVHSVRTTRRVGPDGQDLRQLVIEVTQKRRGFLDAAEQGQQDGPDGHADLRPGEFPFRGGATLIVDLRDGTLRYVIRKKIDDAQRLKEQREFRNTRRWRGLAYTYEAELDGGQPFALVHRGG